MSRRWALSEYLPYAKLENLKRLAKYMGAPEKKFRYDIIRAIMRRLREANEKRRPQ